MSMTLRQKMDHLYRIIEIRRTQRDPIPQDVATHAALLIQNGWDVSEAIEESIRTLDEAEMEGNY